MMNKKLASTSLFTVGAVCFALSSMVKAAEEVALANAVQRRDAKAVQHLLQLRKDVNAAQPDGATALAWAAHWDDTELAGQLIKAKAKVNTANEYGVTPLSLACSNGSAAMVELLLRAGANPNAVELSGETALMTCAHTGNLAAVRLLLARGADVNAAELRRGQTPLMWAVAQGHVDVVRALIERGAAVNAQTAMRVPPPKFDEYTRDLDAHSRSKGGFTPLMFAARNGDVDAARVLLDAGAKVNEVNPEHGTALVVAAAGGHEAFVDFILDKGADPNARDGYGITSLHHALVEGLTAIGGSWYVYRNNSPRMVKSLLAHGADPNVRITKNYEFNSRSDFSLRTTMVGATPFFLAAACGDREMMRVLQAAGADPKALNDDGITPLMAVVELSTIRVDKVKDAVAYLVEQGIDINAGDKEGKTALHGAASVGALDLIGYLVSKGARLDSKNKKGLTALAMVEAGEVETDEYALNTPEVTAKYLREISAGK